MKVIIFHNENGLDCSDIYQADTEEQLDKAAFNYLNSIDNFAWDEKTTKLQHKVENNEIHGIWKLFKSLLSQGYNCFNLDEPIPYVTNNVNM